MAATQRPDFTTTRLRAAGIEVEASPSGGMLPHPSYEDQADSYWHRIYNTGPGVVIVRPRGSTSTDGATRVEVGEVLQTAVWRNGELYELYSSTETDCIVDLYLVLSEV